jgi:pyridoxamine 5'-phosphate oxidase
MGILAKILSLKGVARGLSESKVDPDPIRQFDRWFRLAKRARVFLPNAMTLATASVEGKPSARMMLLKRYDHRGFVFYTNHESRKGKEILENPHASLVMPWPELRRQVRIEGVVIKLSEDESDRYFQSRPRGSRIGAWASHQSSVIPSRDHVQQRYRETIEKYRGKRVPLPPFWGGYRLIPERIEFWQGRPNRLHDRIRYIRENHTWRIVRLAP